MKKAVTALIAGALGVSLSLAIADDHEGEGEANVATPVEMFACRYNEGKGPADLEEPIIKFNEWADEQDIDDYTAWTLEPYYASPNQEFDSIWLGVSPNAKALGRTQDMWLATGTAEQEGFNEVLTCDTHASFSVLQTKEPPERDDPSRIVVAFSDCSLSDGVTFDALYEPIVEWGKYVKEHGSTAGHWVFFPAFGGGGEEFDFKWVTAHQNLEDMGADWDHYNEAGWQKANELFQGKLSCDSARAYIATNQRRAIEED